MRWIFLLAVGSTLWASPIHQTIDELLENDAKRVLKIPHYDPFKRARPLLIKKSTKQKVHRSLPTELSAVFNHKAFINGRWYKKGDVLSEGRVIEVREDSVYLKKGHKIKIFKLKKSKNILKTRKKETP